MTAPPAPPRAAGPLPCRACGFANPPGHRFCGGCGAALEPATHAAEERRLVSILFADVTGSTALGEALDPEDVRALLTRYYGIAREVVTVHGGTIAKFIGDAVMAVFGLPQAHDDDAQRALSAALELRDRVRADARLGEVLPIRLGVNTGEVVATRDPSHGEFLITGDAVNVAARLEQAADPWTVLCAERTARAAPEAFELGPRLEIEAKGKAARVPAYAVLARRRPAGAHRVPLLGRARDLEQLQLLARRAFDERRPFLVSLIAPAGTGKSRLLEAFLNGLPALTAEATVAVAQCLPFGERLTYGPLRPVLHELIGLDEAASAELTRERTLAWLREGEVEAPERVAERLAATVGLVELEVADRTGLFGAWRTAIETAARRGPLVVAFEDLHWSSESLLDLVEFVMQPRAQTPVLMLALARPELLDRRPSWGGGRRNYASLTLEPLQDAAVAELVGHLLEQAPPEVVRRVVDRADGNPFYAGEIVRSIAERLTPLDDAGAIERALAALPDTVHATILARLDRLLVDDRRVLQVGSVLGRSFALRGIRALSGIADLESVAERLIDRDLIRPAKGDTFDFRHILIREVAYGTLPRTERWKLHRDAGRWLERDGDGDEPLAEVIAYHYREAATLGGMLNGAIEELPATRESAVRWLRRAADMAAAAAAFAEAARHLRAAIELAVPEDLPELHEKLGAVTGGDTSAEAYQTAIRLCRERGRPPHQELRLLGSLLTLYTRFQGSIGARPTPADLEVLRERGRQLMVTTTDPLATARFLSAEAFLPFWRGALGLRATPQELATAEASARQALEIAERLDDPALRSATLDALGSLAQERGRYDQTVEWTARRLAFEDRLDTLERIDAYAVLTWASARLGRLGEAERVSTHGLATVQSGQAPAWVLHLTAWRMYASLLTGRWDDLAADGRRARQLWSESGTPTAGYAVRGFIAALDGARARDDGAEIEACGRVVLDILQRIEPGVHHAYMRRYVAMELDEMERRILRDFDFTHGGNVEYAERTLSACADRRHRVAPEIVRPILAFAKECGYRPLVAQARRLLGLTLEDVGELNAALALFEEMGAVPYTARVRCERGLLRDDPADIEAGVRGLEAVGDVDQLERVRGANRRPMDGPP